MNCPGCGALLMGGMMSCPKCKYDILTKDGGKAHQDWLQAKQKTAAEKERDAEQQKRDQDALTRQKQEMLMTTCPSLEGYRITEQYGLVFGEVAYKTGFFKSLDATIDNLVDIYSAGDKELSGTARLLESSRNYAIDKMKTSAADLGANAIIGIDSESSIGGDVMHVTIYGTAVKVEKI